jgi:hypothetical protein
VNSGAADVVRLLTVKGETLAVAESLTGGLVAADITGVPGASKVFRGSVTAYATELKHRLLDVDATLLERRGAVDAQVAAEMAAGVRKALGADWGIATTRSSRWCWVRKPVVRVMAAAAAATERSSPADAGTSSTRPHCAQMRWWW